MKFPTTYQLEAKDCGPACIQMLTEYYGNKISISSLREYCGITRIGASVNDLVECFRMIDFNASALFLAVERVGEMPLPAILFWREDHFVVLYQVKWIRNKKYFFISDPAYGRLRLTQEEFDKLAVRDQKVTAIVAQPTDNFYSSVHPEDKSINGLKAILRLSIEMIGQYKQTFLFAFVLLIISIVCNWSLPIILKKMIDQGVMQENMSVVTKFLFYQLTFFLGYSLSNTISTFILSKISFNASLNYVTDYLEKLVRLPLKFFDTRLNTDLIQ